MIRSRERTVPGERLNRGRLIVIAFACAFLVYRASPVAQVYDSKFSVLVSESLYRRGTFDLSAAVPVDQRGAYQLAGAAGGLYYVYPVGTPILTVPLVMGVNALGLSATGHDGQYRADREVKIQRWLAAILAAGAAAWSLATLLRFVPRGRALGACVAIAFGSSLWSTASRGLWSQTTGVLLLSTTLFVMTGDDRGWRRGLLLGTLLGWMYATRPTSTIAIAAVLLYEATRDWRGTVVTGCVALGWLAAFVAWSEALFHAWRPPYYAMTLSVDTFGEAAAGHLISPSRGVLVFSPWIVGVPWLLARHWRAIERRSLLYVALGAIVGHWVLISAWHMWWFGHSYGPRASLDVVPWLAVLAGLALAAAPRPIGRPTQVVGVVLVALSVAIHSQGAWSRRALQWNATPDNIDAHPARAWDWADAQFLAARRPR